jgi:DMSO/TMAO reductase YedYZ heme-binding membrane subunit
VKILEILSLTKDDTQRTLLHRGLGLFGFTYAVQHVAAHQKKKKNKKNLSWSKDRRGRSRRRRIYNIGRARVGGEASWLKQ